jgi:hypothetical protein
MQLAQQAECLSARLGFYTSVINCISTDCRAAYHEACRQSSEAAPGLEAHVCAGSAEVYTWLKESLDEIRAEQARRAAQAQAAQAIKGTACLWP